MLRCGMVLPSKEETGLWFSAHSCSVANLFILPLGHPNMGGPMQRMTPPRGMVPLGPQVNSQPERETLGCCLLIKGLCLLGVSIYTGVLTNHGLMTLDT